MPIRAGNISRDSPTPLYHQVAEHLRGLITAGEVAAGERLPNEIALAQSFSLSRPTMRQALDELVRDGLISRRRGVGTIVTPHHFRRSAKLTSVFEDLLRAGLAPTTRTLSAAVEEGPHHVAETYGLGADDRVVALERLRSADGVPLVLMRNWLPIRYAFLVSRDVDSLYQAMRERGDVPVTARKAITACAAARRPAELLGVRRGSPLLRVRHVGYAGDGRVLDVGDHLYRADEYAVEVVVS